jgi:hypothetical protein
VGEVEEQPSLGRVLYSVQDRGPRFLIERISHYGSEKVNSQHLASLHSISNPAEHHKLARL